MKTKQKGFALVEGLLILLLVGIIVGTGYYVWKSTSQADKLYLNTAAQTQNSKNTPPTKKTPISSGKYPAAALTSEQKGWQEIISGDGSFSIKIPDGWSVHNSSSEGYLFARSYSSIKYISSTKVNLDSSTYPIDSCPPHHFSIYSTDIKHKNEISFIGTEGTEKTFGPVSGYMGKKYTEIHDYKDPVTHTEVTYTAKDCGLKSYTYVFEGQKYLVSATYYVFPGETDQVNLIEKVIQTLKFN